MQAFCMKCKSQQQMSNATEATTSNGRQVMKGTCQECGTKMNKFMKKQS